MQLPCLPGEGVFEGREQIGKNRQHLGRQPGNWGEIEGLHAEDADGAGAAQRAGEAEGLGKTEAVSGQGVVADTQTGRLIREQTPNSAR